MSDMPKAKEILELRGKVQDLIDREKKLRPVPPGPPPLPPLLANLLGVAVSQLTEAAKEAWICEMDGK